MVDTQRASPASLGTLLVGLLAGVYGGWALWAAGQERAAAAQGAAVQRLAESYDALLVDCAAQPVLDCYDLPADQTRSADDRKKPACARTWRTCSGVARANPGPKRAAGWSDGCWASHPIMPAAL